MECVKMELQEISPGLAVKYLQNNTNNIRSLNKTRVEQWKNVITSGLWQTTHQGIGFSKSGILVDGQHRLSAIAQSGKSVKMWVAYYDSDDLEMLQKSLDSGQKRSIRVLTGLSSQRVQIIGVFTDTLFGLRDIVSPEVCVEIFNDSLSDYAQKILEAIEKCPRIKASVKAAYFAFVLAHPDSQSECLSSLALISSGKADRFSQFSKKDSTIWSYISTHKVSGCTERKSLFAAIYTFLGGKIRLPANYITQTMAEVESVFTDSLKAIKRLGK